MNTLEKVMQKWPEGFKFKKPTPDSLIGECAWWVQQFTTCPLVGSSLAQKKKNLERYSKVGIAFERGKGIPKLHYAVITTDSLAHGHLAAIAELDNKENPKKARLAECNYIARCTVSYKRWIDLSSPKILGFIKCDLEDQFKTTQEQVKDEIPEWGKIPLQKATQKGITFQDTNFLKDISPQEVEEVFSKLSIIQQKLGGMSRIRFLTALNNVNLLE